MLEKVSKEQKQIFLLGDYNMNLLNYNVHQPTNNFLDSLASNSIIPYILQPTRLTSHSKTLIDNIFLNILLSEIISGNLTAFILDFLPYFLFTPNILLNRSYNKSNIFERDWSNLIKKTSLDYFDKNWSDILQLNQQMWISVESFLNNMNLILDSNAPFNRVNKYELRFKSKSLVTPALQKSISVKNSLPNKFIKSKDNNSIYLLQFGFRQKYFTSHALIRLTEDKRNLEEGNVSCGIYVDLQKAFDNLEHDILLIKLEHYDIWFC